MQQIETEIEEGLITNEDLGLLVRKEFAWVSGGWRRVVFGYLTLLQNCCDPDATTLEWRPEIAALLKTALDVVPEALAGTSGEDFLSKKTTPGPWITSFKNAAAYSQVSEKASGKLIAEVHQNLENALMIALAPAMYKALAGVRHLVKDPAQEV